MSQPNNSYCEAHSVICCSCQATFKAQLWVIVDIQEQPEVLSQIQTNTLHQVVCPQCSQVTTANVSFLLYRPRQRPMILFVAANTYVDRHREDLHRLTAHLLQRLDMDEDSLFEEIKRVSHKELLQMIQHPMQKSSRTTSQTPETLREIPQQNLTPTLAKDSISGISILLQQLEQPDHAQGSTQRINKLRQVLQILPQNYSPQMWAALQIDLGTSYFLNLTSDRAENIEQAIAAFENASEVFTRHDFPQQWGIIQNSSATAYYERVYGNRADNIEQAITAYRRALEVRTRTAYPEDWAMTQYNLANAYSKRSHGNRADNIEQAITAYKRALEVRTRTAYPEDWATIQHDLANAYSKRSHGNRADNIEQAITAYERALEVRTRKDFPEQWADTQHNLAFNYYQRICGNRSGNIEQAITAFKCILEVRTRTAFPEQWAHIQHDLAIAYTDRICGNRADNLEKAIAIYECALEVYTQDNFSREWASIQNNLGIAYANRIHGNRAENIERAISLYKRALEVRTRTAFPEQWAESQHNLASVYANRIHGNRAENIERAISLYKRALEVRTRTAFPEQWADTKNNLASVYANRIHGNRAENIERAISLYKRALEVRTRTAFPEQWADTKNNLAITFRKRIHGNRAENIERAISLYKRALEVRTRIAFPEQWAGIQSNLAAALSERICGDRADNIEQAITACEYALEIRAHTNFPEKWAETQTLLANAYSRRIYGNRIDNTKKAIDAYKLALTVYTSIDFPEQWAMLQVNLAAAYSVYAGGNRADNIEQAIKACKHALEIYTPITFPEQWADTQNNLASCYSKRICGDRMKNIDQAITAYENALEIFTRKNFPEKWARTKHNLATTYSDLIDVFYPSEKFHIRTDYLQRAITTYNEALEIFTPKTYPNNCRHTACFIANLYTDSNFYMEATATYQIALAAAETLYKSVLFKSSQEIELKETRDLYRRAAYAYAKVGDIETAITTIEQGRARSLSETLQRDRADLEAVRQINPDLVARYETAATAIRLQESAERRASPDSDQPQSSPEERRNQAIQARQALQASIADIRQIPGYETFLALPTFADIVATLHPGQPLIYLVPTPNGSLALAVSLPPSQQGSGAEGEGQPAPQTAAIWLNNFTETDLRNLLVNDTNTGWFNAYQNQTQDRAAWFAAIDRTLNALWQPVLVPILGHLSQAKCPTATLIPAGLFSLLPLHAAWTVNAQGQRRYACDFIQFTYAPNALALGAARQVAHHTPAQKLLAINEPIPVSASDLPSASVETAKAVSAFAGSGTFKILQHEAATPAAVLAALPSYPVAHFSCHGFANFRIPLDSGLLMANDAVLSLRALLDLKLTGLRLAILSACETGIPGTTLPDEVISLPTGLLQAGAAGVVSSLWSVADLSTMVLLSRFYDLWRPQNPEATPLEPPEALRQAQLWLRDSTGPDLAPYLQNSHPELAAKLAQAKDKRPFAHPFYWAAFTYTGV
jgi:CHAT domain-containing protein/ppGpp synthetase/RelA/SpoT-type nucleotidyltranferase